VPNLRFILYTKGERGSSVLEALCFNNLMPILCVSEDDDVKTKNICFRSKIDLIIEQNPKSNSHLDMVAKINPDLIVGAGYSKIFPKILFEHLRYGGINCHGGKLPEYRGASPIPWQILNGEKSGAAYVLKLTEGIDDGPIFLSKGYEISVDDDARTVTTKVTSIFSEIVPRVIKLFNDGVTIEPISQSEVGACHWTRRYPRDGEVNWAKLSAVQVINLVRALHDPYPGAFFMLNNQKVVIKKASIFPKKIAGIPGRCIGHYEGNPLILAVDGAVVINKVSINGKILEGCKIELSYGDDISIDKSPCAE